MTFQNKLIQKIWRFATSFNLGIPVMVALTALTAWGTIVESRYDAWTAKQVVYGSWLMWTALTMLCLNLLAVVIDRWPWKSTHYPFVTVHFGIIIIVIGGWITGHYGIDGSMALPIKGQSQLVTIPPTDFVVYATYDGDRYAKIYEKNVDFYNQKLSENSPFLAQLENDHTMKITRYMPYARVSKKLTSQTAEEALKTQSGSSIKIQLSNANVKQIETLTQPKNTQSANVNLGPLAIYLGHDLEKKGRKNKDANEVYFQAVNDSKVKYLIYKKGEVKPVQTGDLEIGALVQTQWMGLQIKLIDYRQYAFEQWDVKEMPRPTPLTTAAVFVEYKDKKQWLLLNDVVKFFGETVAFIVSYQNRRIDLGFPIQLKDFQVTRYQGTSKAMEYASRVIAGKDSTEEIVISMNEPLKFNGYTFYQASFVEDENTGQPSASVLSVNKDPGRWVKYFGSLVLCLGIIWIFYQRRNRKTAL